MGDGFLLLTVVPFYNISFLVITVFKFNPNSHFSNKDWGGPPRAHTPPPPMF